MPLYILSHSLTEMETLRQVQSFGSFVVSNRASWLVFIIILVTCCSSLHIRARPLIPNSPFLSIWNAPTEVCTEKTRVQLDMRLFHLVGSTLKTSTEQSITIFYANRLGNYPYIDENTGETFNGGIPQLCSIEHHLKKARDDINFYMPSDEQVGLAVIDWENWRPLWIRNWKSKDIYRQVSVEFVQQKDLSLSETQARTLAKMEFEAAAKSLMLQSLKLGISMKPNHLWGYYLYPDCYNYDYKQNPHNYTGSCLDIEIERNNELNWLWEESTALYPSVYLETALRSSKNAPLFVRNRVAEAIRVSNVSNSTCPLPIFVYTRPVFTDFNQEYLSQDDLVNTIGESAALGVSGIVIWGDLNLTLSVNTCRTLDSYLRHTLNPYIINVTMAAKICSQILCHDSGACARKNWNSSDYLHLNPENFFIQMSRNGKYSIQGQPSFQDLQRFIEKFYCRCYAGYNCEPSVDINDIHYINACISEDICVQVSLNSFSNVEASGGRASSSTSIFSSTPQRNITLPAHNATGGFQQTICNNTFNVSTAGHINAPTNSSGDLKITNTHSFSGSSSDEMKILDVVCLILILRNII
ncbi:hyaluronidase PH-20 [Gopherus flavomarginatus]|uniref:hyaluronidase PH-20 n=1 Tax=Gopherus flavomarginatus TaxID=286002 RepID=UPI0021CC265E|nr:hyaluronidase PH-20 [Gopherus flavomarginatus]